MNTPPADHPGEVLMDFLDGRLGPSEHAGIEAHLLACARCRKELEQLRWTRTAVAALAVGQEPAPLRGLIASTLDQEDGAARTPPVKVVPRRTRRWRLGLGVAAAALILVVLLATLRPRGLPEEVARDFSRYQASQLDLKTEDAPTLQRLFADSALGFAPKVYDLSMMNYRIEGGQVLQLHNRPGVLTAYRSAGERHVLCVMYHGEIAQLAAGAKAIEHAGVRFLVFEIDGLTEVFWQEGSVVCVLVSDIPAGEILNLAFAKATKT